MTLMIDNPSHIKQLKALGFTYAIFVARNVSLHPVGTISCAFRLKADANHMKAHLCSKFGKFTYEVTLL